MRKAEVPAKKIRNKRAIRKLAENLADVLDAFGWYGISSSSETTGEPQPSSNDPSGDEAAKPVTTDGVDPGQIDVESTESEEEEYGEDDDGFEDNSYANPEDIQMAVDEAISSLMKDGLIPEFVDATQAPSLSDVFGVLFGEEHELTKRVEYFEELVNGYEDRASVDDLEEACKVLREVLEEISPRKLSRSK